ncbi:MAG: histidinol phosphatase [Bacillota bacterium]
MSLFLYDPHVHTKETSRCGWIPAATLVELYHEHKYAGIVVTDHMHETYISLLDCSDDWDACVDSFLTGYRLAKQRADELDMDVILGMELRFPENNNDYLVYGIDEAFLRRNPYMYRMGHSAFYQTFKDEVLIIQAHPFRDENSTVFFDSVHGLEIINCSPRHDNFNDRALESSTRYPDLLRSCSSDAHRPGDEARAALAFNRRIRDSFAFRRAMQEHACSMQCEEFQSIIDQCKMHFGGATA